MVNTMRKDAWNAFFGNLSKQFTVSLIARKETVAEEGSYLAVSPTLPIYDTIDLLEKHERLILPDGRVVKKSFMLKRPLRIIFFIMLTELESRLYRTQEWSNRPLKELNDKNMNDLIRDLVNDPVLFSYQNEYKTKNAFKEDLKAVCAMRNQIVHVNKKLEFEVDFDTIIKRKKQMQKLLDVLVEILNHQELAKSNENKSP
jgi:hypothetical protein